MVIVTKSDTDHANRSADHAGATNNTTPRSVNAAAAAHVRTRETDDSSVGRSTFAPFSQERA
jgi:hypothetical protein